MNEQTRPPSAPDSLEQALQALLATPVSAGLTEELMSSTLQSVESHRSQLSERRPPGPRKPRMVRYLGYGALAAAAMLLIGIVLSGIGGGTAAALDKAFERVGRAESVRFRVSDSVIKPDDPLEDAQRGIPDWLRQTVTIAHSKPACEVTVSRKKFRIDDVLGPGTSWIIDWEQKAALISDSSHRTFEKIDMQQIAVSPLDFESMNICDELLALRKQTARFEGTEEVDSLTTDKYSVSRGKAFHTQGDWVIWIGRETGLPVRVTVDFDVRGIKVTRLYEAFDWKPRLDPSTFSLDPPAGFQERLIMRALQVVPAGKSE